MFLFTNFIKAASCSLAVTAIILLNTACYAQSIQIDPPKPTLTYEPLTDFAVKQTIKLIDHGVIPDDGKDDRAALVAVIEQVAKQNIPSKLIFKPGKYLFSSMPRRVHAVNLINMSDLIIDGQGSTITMTNPECGVFNVRLSQRIIIKNFSEVDYDPLPFTQGTLVAVDKKAQTFDLRVDEGFPLPSESYFTTCQRSWGQLKDRHVPAKLKDLAQASAVFRCTWEDQGDRIFRFKTPETECFDWMEPGDKYVHLARTNMAQFFHCDDAQDITAMNMTIYASPASTFAANSCTRFSVIGCKALLKPGRWHSNNADAIHCQRNRIGPLVENCYFEGIIDDPVNIYSVRSRILKRIDDHNLLIKLMKPRTFNQEAVGQILTLLRQRNGTIIGSFTITNVQDIDNTVKITVDGKLPELLINDAKNPRDDNGDVAFSGHNLSRHFVLRNNTFRVGQRHCVIMGGHGIVEGNTFDQLSGPGLSILNHNRGLNDAEGLLTGDLIIRNNTFINCDFGPFAYAPKQAYGNLYLGSKTWDRKPGQDQLIGRVLIENNTFTNIRKAGINLNNAHDVLIQNNTFTSSMDTPLDPDVSHAAIMMDNASKVKITNNKLTDPRQRKLTFITKSDTATQIEAKDNWVE
jgi:hypothetical protein